MKNSLMKCERIINFYKKTVTIGKDEKKPCKKWEKWV